MTSVFLSYSQSVFPALIRDIKQQLRDIGFYPIDPRGIEPANGLRIDEEDSISSMIRRSGIFIAVIFDENPNVYFELGVAIGQQKRTLIVHGHHSELPSFARRLTTLRAESWTFQTVMDIVRWVQDNSGNTGLAQMEFRDLGSIVHAARNDSSVWDLVTPTAFEHLVIEWFRHRGCIVESPAARNDYGFDFTLAGYKHYQRTLVQVKKYTSTAKISIPTVQQLLGAVHMYRANAGLLIATGGFTSSAIDFAEKCMPPIELLSADQLIDAL